MVGFSHVAFDQFSLDVLAIRLVNGGEVFFDGNLDAGRHAFRVALAIRLCDL